MSCPGHILQKMGAYRSALKDLQGAKSLIDTSMVDTKEGNPAAAEQSLINAQFLIGRAEDSLANHLEDLNKKSA